MLQGQAGQQLSKATAFWSSLGSFRSVRAVGFGSILIFLLIYTLVIGPGDYFLLKKLKRSHLTWITFPIIVLGTIGFTCWWAIMAKGGQYLSNTVTIVDVLSDGRARVHEYTMLFSPKAGRLKMSGPEHGWIGEGPEYMQNSYDDSGRQVFDEDTSTFEIPVQQWSRKRVQAHFPENISGDLILQYAETTDLRMIPQLVNRTSMHFIGGHLLHEQIIYQVPEMTAGGEVLILRKISKARGSLNLYAYQTIDFFRIGPMAPPQFHVSNGKISPDSGIPPSRFENSPTGSRKFRPPPVRSISHADVIPGRNNLKRTIFIGKSKLEPRLKIGGVTPVRERQDAYIRAIVKVEGQP